MRMDSDVWPGRWVWDGEGGGGGNVDNSGGMLITAVTV